MKKCNPYTNVGCFILMSLLLTGCLQPPETPFELSKVPQVKVTDLEKMQASDER